MLPLSPSNMSLAANLVLFAVLAGAVWVAGSRLAIYADEIADRKRIGKALMGFVFLAAATELPEMATTATASIAGNATLALGNMFGGITLQTAILVVADAMAVHAALTIYPRKTTPALEGALLVLLLTLLLGISILGETELVWNIGFGTAFLMVAYVLSVMLLRNHDEKNVWIPVEVPEEQAINLRRNCETFSATDLYVRFGLASLIILVCGAGLVSCSQAIADQTGLGSSFIGVSILAAATSLPELSTTISAARLGAYTMAISNIIGSNLIMLALLLPADIMYRANPILMSIDSSARLALVAGVLVTAIYIIGLLVRSKKRFFGLGIDSLAVLAVYLCSLVVFYQIR